MVVVMGRSLNLIRMKVMAFDDSIDVSALILSPARISICEPENMDRMLERYRFGLSDVTIRLRKASVAACICLHCRLSLDLLSRPLPCGRKVCFSRSFSERWSILANLGSVSRMFNLIK